MVIDCFGRGHWGGIWSAPNALFGKLQFERVNRGLHGTVQDFTKNHGKDRRIFSPAMGEKRDMYVYLPPGYDPSKSYPLAIFLHGAAQDEEFFSNLRWTDLIRPLPMAN